MPLTGEYEPSTSAWSRKQTELYEATDGEEGGDLRGRPVIVLTSVGAKTGKLRKTALMRVEHDGVYAVVASLGGAPKHPVWYYNLKKHPHVELQDGATKLDYTAREVVGEEKAVWWERAVETWPDYATTRPRRNAEPGLRAGAHDVGHLFGARLSNGYGVPPARGRPLVWSSAERGRSFLPGGSSSMSARRARPRCSPMSRPSPKLEGSQRRRTRARDTAARPGAAVAPSPRKPSTPRRWPTISAHRRSSSPVGPRRARCARLCLVAPRSGAFLCRLRRELPPSKRWGGVFRGSSGSPRTTERTSRPS